MAIQLLCLCASVGSQAHDLAVATHALLLAPYLVQTLHAVHLWHLVVHKNHVIIALACLAQCLATACGGIDVDSCIAEQLLYHLEVHGGVVDRKNPYPCRHDGMLVRSGLGFLRLPQIERPNGSRVHNALRYLDMKDRTLPVFACDAHRAAHEVKELLNDGEAEARTLDSVRVLLVDTLKGRKELRNALLADANARVRDVKYRPKGALLVGPPCNAELD